MRSIGDMYENRIRCIIIIIAFSCKTVGQVEPSKALRPSFYSCASTPSDPAHVCMTHDLVDQPEPCPSDPPHFSAFAGPTVDQATRLINTR